MAYQTSSTATTVEHRTFQATLFCDGVGGQWQEIQFQRMRNYFDAEGKLIDRAIDPNPIVVLPEMLAGNATFEAMIAALQNLVDDLDRQRRAV